jgi:hypothetical protein
MEVFDGQRGLQTGSDISGRDLSKGRMKALQSFETSGAADTAHIPEDLHLDTKY